MGKTNNKILLHRKGKGKSTTKERGHNTTTNAMHISIKEEGNDI
jgi:hypothetical protein